MADVIKNGTGVVLGVDIGGTSVKLALVTDQGRIVDSVRYPTRCGRLEDLLSSVNDQAAELLARNPACCLTAAGVGVKSVTDFRRQRVSSSTLVTDARDFDITIRLRDTFHIPVVMDNDVNAMAMGEVAFGWGRQRSSFVYINVGTGLGACPILDGQPYRGTRGWAGELCNCLIPDKRRSGHFRPLEALVSGLGCDDETHRLAPDYPGSCLQPILADPSRRIRSNELFSACRRGDALAAAVTDDMAFALAMSLLNIEALLDCGFYVFGGGVMNDPWFLDRLRKAADRLAEKAGISNPMIMELSRLGANDSGTIGAAALAYSYIL